MWLMREEINLFALKRIWRICWLGTAESSIRGQRVEALFVFERLKTDFSRHGTWWKWSVKRFMTPSGKYDWDVVSLCHFEKIKYLRVFNSLHVWGHLEDITDGLDCLTWIFCKKRLRSCLEHLNGKKMSWWWLFILRLYTLLIGKSTSLILYLRHLKQFFKTVFKTS